MVELPLLVVEEVMVVVAEVKDVASKGWLADDWSNCLSSWLMLPSDCEWEGLCDADDDVAGEGG